MFQRNPLHRSMRTRLGAVGVVTIGLLLSAQGCPAATTHTLDWGVVDKDAGETDVADGGTFAINGSHHYLVTLRVKDPAGIKSMAVWASGNLNCESDPDPNNGMAVYGGNFSAGVARSDNTLPNASGTNSFIMSKEFAFFDLDCGKHYYGTLGQFDFTAMSGTLHFYGEETDANGVKTTATLNLANR